MTRLLKADLYRLFKSKSFYVIGGVLVGYLLLNMLMNLVVLYILDGFITITLGAMMLSTANASNLGLFVVIAISVFNGSDFKNNTVRNKVVSDNSKANIFVSAWIINMLMYVILFVAAELVTFALGAAMFSFEFSPMFALEFFGVFFIGIGVATIATFITFATKSTMTSVVINVLICVFLIGIFSLFSNYFFVYRIQDVGYGTTFNYAFFEWITRLNIYSAYDLVVNAYPLYEVIKATEDGAFTYMVMMYVNAFITTIVWGGAAFGGGILISRKMQLK